MGIIKVSHLKPEALLSEDVKDRNGRLLIPAGTILTETHIRVIKIWGIVEVEIEDASETDPDSSSAEAIDPEQLQAAETLLQERFLFCDREHPAIAELFRIGRQRLAAQMAKSPPGKRPSQTTSGGRRSSGRGRSGRTAESCEDRFSHIHQLIQKDIKLTTLPAVFKRINETIMNPNSSSREIADLISADTGLSARLLKLVNSVFYGYPSQIDSLSQAVSIVGTNQLSVLAFGIDIVGQFKRISSRDIDMESFWRHSIACGVIARLLASTRNIQNTERLFVAGILHDIGRLIIYHYTPRYATDILEMAGESGKLLRDGEEEYLGGDHSRIGALLLQIWKLPQSLENAVRHHHNPSDSQSILEPAIVHVADIAALALGTGSSGDTHVPPLDPAAWKQLGLSVNGLEPIATQAERQMNEIFQFFCQ
ncbi:MAG: HDOD domain-containing protein [Deltaproteobacteria bacterium]|nr:HDOD domain-containing protein [Deltaproteobacteria bacterium]